MEIDLNKIIMENPVLLTFVVIAVGYLFARIKVGSIELGSTAGVLIAGLLFGHLGFHGTGAAATFGFTLFIFSVGIQAGPRFFSVFLEDGPKYIMLALVVALAGVGITLGISKVIPFDFGIRAGVLAGALTSTPTLAGAQDAITSGLVDLPQGMTALQASTNVSVAYAITYLFGTVGLIVFIRYFPVILRIDLPAEARQLAQERGLLGRTRRQTADQLTVIRAYRVSDDEAPGKTIEELGRITGYRFKALRIRRGDEILDLSPDLQIQKGDVISVMGTLKNIEELHQSLGEEVLDPKLLNFQTVSREIVVINAEVVGKSLGDLRLVHNYGCFATSITRASIEIPVNASSTLQKGDRLEVTGEESRLKKLAEHIGHIEEEMKETDLFTYALGIIFGILAGTMMVQFGKLSIGLGSAGGLMLAGIMIGYLRSLHPTFGRVPAAALWLLMEFGLLLFMASVGLKAGGGIVAAFKSVGLTLMLVGVAVTVVPVLVAYAFGRFILKLNPALLLGAITGAMTSTPSLSIVSEAAKSPVPSLGYAGTYTFANVFLTFAGTLLMTL